eukprot:g27787.t1
MFLGKCFKKCSDLTAKQYPVRTSAATCCATSNLIECINPSNSKMSMDFAVGGGVSEKAHVDVCKQFLQPFPHSTSARSSSPTTRSCRLPSETSGHQV